MWPHPLRRARLSALVPLAAAAAVLAAAAGTQSASGDAQRIFARLDSSQEFLQRMRTAYVWISAWPAATIVHHLLVLCVLVAAFVRVRQCVGVELRVLLLGLAALGVLSMPLSWLFLEHFRWGLVPQVQPLRVLLFLTLGMQFFTAAAGARAIAARRPVEALAWLTFAYLLPLQPVLTGPFVWTRVGARHRAGRGYCLRRRLRRNSLGARRRPRRLFRDPLGRRRGQLPALHTPDLAGLSAWARANTRRDAVFVFPGFNRDLAPGIFRSEALRAVYVDWKGGGQVNYLKDLGEQWWFRWRQTRTFQPADLPQYRRSRDHLRRARKSLSPRTAISKFHLRCLPAPVGGIKNHNRRSGVFTRSVRGRAGKTVQYCHAVPYQAGIAHTEGKLIGRAGQMPKFSRRGLAGFLLAPFFRLRGQSGATLPTVAAAVSASGQAPPTASGPPPRVISRTYRADATILVLGITVFRRPGVGGGRASLEEASDGASLRRTLFFAAGSDPSTHTDWNGWAGFAKSSSGPRQRRRNPTISECSRLHPKRASITPEKRSQPSQPAAVRFSAVNGRNTAGRSRSAVTHFEFAAGTNWSDRGLIDHAQSTFRTDVDWRETSWPNLPNQAPPTFLLQLTNLLKQPTRRAVGRYVYNEQEYLLELDRPQSGKDREGLLQVRGKIRNLHTGVESPFRLWLEDASDSIVPVRIEFQPRSFLRLTFEAVPA